MGAVAFAAGVAIALPGSLLFLVYGRKRTKRRGVVGQRGRRQELLLAESNGESLANSTSETAEAVVVLLGSERSPELLVELAASLSNGKRMEVALLTELPEQTALDAVEHDPRAESVRRRVEAVAEAKQLDVSVWSAASHDIIGTTHEVSRRLNCSWLVMEWAGRSRHSFTFRNPLGWLKDHLSCNFATFHDAGVRYVRKILVYVEPGPHDALVVRTAEELARVHGADLTFARFVPDSAPATHAQSAADYLDQIHHLAEHPSQVLLVRGQHEVQAMRDVSSAYDLLVTADAPQPGLMARMRRIGRDRLTEAAACSVLRLQTPRGRTHEALDRARASAEPPVVQRLPSDFLLRQCVRARLDPMRKDALFRQFANDFADALPGLDRAEIVKALWARERTQNTAVGHGVALPHATITTVDRSYLGIFTVSRPTDYQAPDRQPVDVFFVTMGPPSDRSAHLLLLAGISRLVLQTPLLDGLRQAADSEAILRTIRDCEAASKSSQ
jgi:mannitol/fructose-specific phosphotransferase system IIA component (Ntr-type)